MPRFLILRFSSIGDIVLTTPVVRCLKQQVPGAEIHYLTKPAFETLLSPNPYIDKVWIWNEEERSELLAALRQQQFDAVIDLHHNLRTARVKRALGIKAYALRKLNIEKYLYVNFRINRLPDLHIVDRYLETVRSFGVKNDEKGLDFFIRPEDEVMPEYLPESHRNGFIAVVAGALQATKRLPNERLVELCRKIALPLVLFGGKNETEDGILIAERAGKHVLNTCGKLLIGQSASLLHRANVVISPDTGLMHIAAAFHKPVISVWGNTVPAFGMYPYLPGEPEKNVVFEVNGLRCRPCSKIGYPRCPKEHFNCMMMQDLDEMARKAAELYRESVGPV